MKYTNGMYLFLSLVFAATTKLQSFLVDRAKTKHWDITTIATKLNISDERYVQLRDVRDPWEQLEMLIYLSQHYNVNNVFVKEALDTWHNYFIETLIYGQMPVLPMPLKSAPDSVPTALQRLCSQGRVKPLLYATLATLAALDANTSTLKITLMSSPNNYDADDTRCTDANIANVTSIRIDGRIML